MGENVLTINAENWEAEVTQSDVPVVIDFWAEWCGPCKKLGPIFEEVAQGFSGKMKFGKYDIDADREIPSRLGVMSIPALVFFKGGEEVERAVGLIPASTLEQKVQSVLG